MAREVRSNFGTRGIKTVSRNQTNGTHTASSSSIDGGFPEKMKQDVDKRNNGKGDAEDSNSSGVQSNSYSDYSDGCEPGNNGLSGGDTHQSLVEHITGNGCSINPGSYRAAKFPTASQPVSATQTPLTFNRFKRDISKEDPYGPMSAVNYFPPPRQALATSSGHLSEVAQVPATFCSYHPEPAGRRHPLEASTSSLVVDSKAGNTTSSGSGRYSRNRQL